MSGISRCPSECNCAFPTALTVGVDPDMDAWCGRRNDVITVQRLDLDNVKVLSAVMAQTVVLQHYEDLVDRLHEVVATLNTHVEKRDLKKLDTEALYKCVAVLGVAVLGLSVLRIR
jgi:hypothetical protein